MADQHDPTQLIEEMQDLSQLATKALRAYLTSDDGNRAARDKAKTALGVINTSVSLVRAHWTQQRHQTSIARTLADGDLDLFQGFVRNAMPGFPEIRKAPLPAPKEPPIEA